ncbi:hypothetical protein CRE_17625 [Caenorhabditis remanei]|uniref:HAT C-terminal dimerisation domain-containing protein n=1 Tax=Caenorhabditis remanei TaxID=31234 RepID=E3NIR9_CAERE|nr:hypothetical protein CRE_17625 [Caenorhabditis remanei]
MGKYSHLFKSTVTGKLKCTMCNYECEKKKSGSTFLQVNHIEKNHPEEKKKVEAKEKSIQNILTKPDGEKTVVVPSIFQPTIWPDNHEEAVKLTRLITEMICRDRLPLSFSENPGFAKLMKYVKPRYRIKSRFSFSRVEIPKLFKELRDNLQIELNNAEHVAIAYDLWSDDGLKFEVIGVLAYFLKDGEVVHRVLGLINCKNVEHSGHQISKLMREMLEKYNILTKTVCFMRDGASNAIKACEIIGLPSFDCLNHKLHLAAKDGTEAMIGLKRVIENYKKIVRKLKKSSVSQKEFTEIQKLYEIPELCLIKGIDVRWGSLRSMFLRAQECRLAINEFVMSNPTVPKISDSDWNLIDAVCDLLKPITEQSDNVQKRGSTGSIIIPLCTYLIDLMNENSEHPEASRAIALRMQSELSKYKKCNVLHFATLLDIRFKDMFSTTGVKEAFIEQAELDFERETPIADVEDCGPPPAKKQLNDGFLQYIQGKIKKSTKSEAEVNYGMAIKLEFDKFLAIPPDPSANPIQYWMSDLATSVFPLLQKHAKKYLIVPPGSSEVERIFSTASHILTKYRKNLSAEHFEQLLFLNKNLALMN